METIFVKESSLFQLKLQSISIAKETVVGQVSVWQLAWCASLLPVPAWVEEPVSPVRQSSSYGASNSPLSQDALAVGCRNWHGVANLYSATGGEHDQEYIIGSVPLLFCMY